MTACVYKKVLALKKIQCYHLYIGPGPCVGELIHIYISCCESLQGQLCLSVKIQDGLLLDEVGK